MKSWESSIGSQETRCTTSGERTLSYPRAAPFCNAHLLRELTSIKEFDFHLWATEMKIFHLSTNLDETDRNAVLDTF